MATRDDLWKRADRLLDEALDRPPEERTRLLDRECGNDDELRALVERLLANLDSGSTFLTPGGALDGSIWDSLAEETEEPADLTGQVVDRYRVLDEIGRGGMAVVYRAERADGQFEQHVALKLIKRGIDTDEVVRRFSRERQIMAVAKHPNIARLMDGGATDDGRPYFVMEYVEGQPIDRFCDAERLSIDDRLTLFLQVCDAVSYAHRNLVVHRDIKPSNILVTPEGEAKLLDFGIAGYLADEDQPHLPTRTQHRYFTPAFASPEQVRGEAVTTASDIYQLGLLLYRLLTGHSPYRVDGGDPDELRRAICDTPANRPSLAVTQATPPGPGGQGKTPEQIGVERGMSPGGLRRELSGDLDNIAMMALRKEPERRYRSVAQLMEDIERLRSDHPVSARPDTLAYRSSKFIHRHKVAVGFAGVALLLLISFAVTMAVQAGRIARERDRANQEAETADRVSEFMVSLFEVSDPGEARGNSITAREILDRGAERIGDELEDQPAVRAKMMDTMGRVYQNLGLYDDATPLLEQALDTRRESYRDGHVDLAESLYNVAWMAQIRGDYDEAEEMLREALEMNIRFRGPDHWVVATCLNDLAIVLHRKEDYAAAEPLYRQSLAVHEKANKTDDKSYSAVLNNLASLLQHTGDLDGAEPLFRKSLELNRRKYGDDHPDVSANINNLALLLKEKGDYHTAEPLYREAMALDRRVLGDQHPNSGISTNNLADLLYTMGDYDAAEPLFHEAMIIWDASLPGHWLAALGHGNYGACLTKLGRYEEAQPHLRQAYSGLSERLGAEHERTQKAIQRLVELYEVWNRGDEASRYRALLDEEPAPTGE